MRLPGGKVVCAGPPPRGGAPTPVKRVSSEAPGRAVKRVLSSLVPRSSLIVRSRCRQQPWYLRPLRAQIRVLPGGQCKDRGTQPMPGCSSETHSVLAQRKDPIAAKKAVLITSCLQVLQLPAQFGEVLRGSGFLFEGRPQRAEQRLRRRNGNHQAGAEWGLHAIALYFLGQTADIDLGASFNSIVPAKLVRKQMHD